MCDCNKYAHQHAHKCGSRVKQDKTDTDHLRQKGMGHVLASCSRSSDILGCRSVRDQCLTPKYILAIGSWLLQAGAGLGDGGAGHGGGRESRVWERHVVGVDTGWGTGERHGADHSPRSGEGSEEPPSRSARVHRENHVSWWMMVSYVLEVGVKFTCMFGLLTYRDKTDQSEFLLDESL